MRWKNTSRRCKRTSNDRRQRFALDGWKTDTNGTTQYAWDYENRLTSVTLPNGGGVVTFQYDPFGRRIQKSSATGTTNYVYDGANIVGEYNASASLVAKYEQGSGIDQPLAMSRGGATIYYHADGLGSITSLTDAAGQAQGYYSYDSFGKPIASPSNISNPFRYTGREWDQETGLYYYRARYYDSNSGHFLSEDPIEFAGGPNFYSYALNRPSILVDPSGLDGHTWGPITLYTNQKGMSAVQVKAEKAHEAQHRCDFWNGNVFTQSCEYLESRGFTAEIPIIQERLITLAQQKTLTAAEKHEMQQLKDELSLAQGMSDPKGVMIHYYCNPPSTWASPEPLNSPPAPGWALQ